MSPVSVWGRCAEAVQDRNKATITAMHGQNLLPVCSADFTTTHNNHRELRVQNNSRAQSCYHLVNQLVCKVLYERVHATTQDARSTGCKYKSTSSRQSE